MVGETPQENIHRFVPRGAHGRGRVGVRLTGLDIRDNQQQTPARTQFPITNERRDQIIRYHIGAINDMRVAKGLPPLTGADIANMTAAAQHTANPSSESIMQAVLSSANATLPSNAQEAFKKHLADAGVTEAQYNQAVARFGVFGSLEAAIFAARSIGSGGSPSGSAYSSTSGSTYTGNLAAISMTNYTSAGSQFYATGMTYGTFNYLRAYTLPDGNRFSGTNILHAGQDTRHHGLDPNNRRVVRNFATVDHYDGDRREERNKLLGELAGRAAADPEAQRLKREYDAAGTEEEKKRIAGQIMERGRTIQNEPGGYGAFVQRGPEQARKPGAEIGNDVWGKSLGIHERHRVDLSASPGGTAPSAAPVVAANQGLGSITQTQAPIAAPLAAQTDKALTAGARRTEPDRAAAADDAFGVAAEPPVRQADAGTAAVPAAGTKPKEEVKTAAAEPPKEAPKEAPKEPVKTASVAPPATPPAQGAKTPPAKPAAAPKMNA